MTDKATPRPWTYEEHELSEGFSTTIYDANGHRIADHLHVDVAALIVTAVNAHDELVPALRGAIGALEFSRDYHRDLGNEDQAFCQDKLDAAVAALSKLEHKP